MCASQEPQREMTSIALFEFFMTLIMLLTLKKAALMMAVASISNVSFLRESHRFFLEMLTPHFLDQHASDEIHTGCILEKRVMLRSYNAFDIPPFFQSLIPKTKKESRDEYLKPTRMICENQITGT